jgi:hypothetical protein
MLKSTEGQIAVAAAFCLEERENFNDALFALAFFLPATRS